LQVRIESPIPKSLVLPFLSVLNEIHLYTTWLPQWSTPKFRLKRCKQLCQSGRVSQIILMTLEMPWPLQQREVVLDANGIDDIDKNGIIGIIAGTFTTSNNCKNIDVERLIPPVEGGTVRMDMEGVILFQKCPTDHPALNGNYSSIIKEVDEEDMTPSPSMVLITSYLSVDPKLQFVPQSFVNFVVRTVIGSIWNKLLQVANDVKNGKRPDHEIAIQSKRKILYDWVEERTSTMMKVLAQQTGCFIP